MVEGSGKMNNGNENIRSLEECKKYIEFNNKKNNYISEAAQLYKRIIIQGFLTNNIIHEFGKHEFSKEIVKGTLEYQQVEYVTDNIYDRAMYNYIISIFEWFLLQFALENINIKYIKNRDDLITYLKKKYNFQKINFQNMNNVAIYYKYILDIDIKGKNFIAMKNDIDIRHINMHNFGLVDEKFKRSVAGKESKIDEWFKIDREKLYIVIEDSFNFISELEEKFYKRE